MEVFSHLWAKEVDHTGHTRRATVNHTNRVDTDQDKKITMSRLVSALEIHNLLKLKDGSDR